MSCRKTVSITVSIMVLVMVQMASAGVAASDLVETYGWARKNDMKYLAALSRYKADMLYEDIGKAGMRPHVGYSYRWKKNEYESDVKTVQYTGDTSFNFFQCEDFACLRDELLGLEWVDTHSKYSSKESALTLTQTIYDAKRFAERSKGKLGAVKAAAEMDAAEHDLLVRLVGAYLDVLRAADEKAFALQQLESIEVQKKLAAKRYELGVGKETDVYDTQAAYDAQMTVYEMARVLHFTRLQQLSGITGVEMSAVYPLSENMPVEVPYPNEADHWIRIGMEKNAGIRVAQAAEQYANYEMREKKYAHMPVVNFGAAYIETDLEGGQGYSPAATTKAYGIELALPIYAGGSIDATSKQASYRLDEAKQNLVSQRQLVKMGIVNMLLMIKTDVKRYYSGSQTVISSGKALEMRRRAYTEGASTLLDLFQAERNYFLARKELSAARYDYILNVFRLHQLAGSLSPKELSQFNAWAVPPL